MKANPVSRHCGGRGVGGVGGGVGRPRHGKASWECLLQGLSEGLSEEMCKRLRKPRNWHGFTLSSYKKKKCYAGRLALNILRSMRWQDFQWPPLKYFNPVQSSRPSEPLSSWKWHVWYYKGGTFNPSCQTHSPYWKSQALEIKPIALASNPLHLYFLYTVIFFMNHWFISVVRHPDLCTWQLSSF